MLFRYYCPSNGRAQYVHDTLPSSTLKALNATGRCPHMSAPKETIEAIKDRFNQKGTGLGLSYVKNMVQKLGGKIHVTSEVKKGSTFYFTIAKKWGEK